MTDEFVDEEDVADIKERLRRLVNRIEADPQPPAKGNRLDNWHQVLFLSTQRDRETVQLPARIVNDKVDRKGRGTAFTMRFCYVTLDSLKRAHHTSGLKTVKPSKTTI